MRPAIASAKPPAESRRRATVIRSRLRMRLVIAVSTILRITHHGPLRIGDGLSDEANTAVGHRRLNSAGMRRLCTAVDARSEPMRHNLKFFASRILPVAGQSRQRLA